MSATRPLLGIMSCNRDIGGRYGQVVANRYVDPVLHRMNAAGLIIPAASELRSIRQIAAVFDGLLLTGSPTNVLPSHYDAPVDPRTGPFDVGRDEVVFALIEALIERGKPVFGICRGFQEINVFFGGKLRCDVAHSADLYPHHRPVDGELAFPDFFEHFHGVDIQAGGMLDGVFSRRRLDVNSVHYQGVAAVGRELAVEAVAEDGLVEAVSTRIGDSTLLGVQWHPEWDLATNPDSQALFDHFARLLHTTTEVPQQRQPALRAC